jgi:hypothetical protein
MNMTTTTWTDAMILYTIRMGHALTPRGENRARVLAADGLIDMTGTWRLTEAGAALADCSNWP